MIMRAQYRHLKSFAVCYEVQLVGQPLYTGACLANNLLDMPDAWRNSLFREHVNPTTDITVTVLSTHHTLEDAQAAASERPHYFNTAGKDIPALTGRVRCIDTGDTYDNASQAATAWGSSSAQMSNHLNGKKYCRSVAGKRFERI